MSWHYLQELVGVSSEEPCSGGKPSAPWKKNRTAEKCCSEGRETACYPCSPSGTTLQPSTENLGVESWMSYLRDSRASRLALQEKEKVKKTNETSGRKLGESLAKYDPNTHSWRTYQGSSTMNIGELFLAKWPKSATMLNGVLYPQPHVGPRTSDKDSGFWPTSPLTLFPTPSASGGTNAGGANSARAAKVRGTYIAGRVNPEFQEWLMSWPIGWTALEPLGTDKFRLWLQEHGSN